MAKIAEAFVEISAKTDKLKRGVRQSMQSLKVSLGNMARFIGRWAKRITLVIGAAFVAGFTVAVKAASDAEQVFSKFRIIMGDLADETLRWADALAFAVGRSRTDIADSLSTFQAFFKGLGFGNKESAELAKTMSQLAIDFGSFFNVSDSESLQRFISALSGSGEVLDRFGINIKQAALDVKLLELGFPKVSKGATETEKALARVAIITETLTQQGALGNAVETAGEFSNVMKRLRAELKELAVRLGNVLLPTITAVFEHIVDIASWLKTTLPAVLNGVFSIARTGLARLKIGILDLRSSLADLVHSLNVVFSSKAFQNILSTLGLKGAGFAGIATLTGVEGVVRGGGKARAQAEIGLILAALGIRPGRGGGVGGVKAPTLPDLSGIFAGAGAGGAAGGGAGGLISSIQTAIGAFKTGQDPQQRVLEDIEANTERQLSTLQQIRQAVLGLGPSE